MKQYLVVKLVAEQIGKALSVIPLGGLWKRDEAEAFAAAAHEAEPDSIFLVQEVGVA
jgi:hypothetical protein